MSHLAYLVVVQSLRGFTAEDFVRNILKHSNTSGALVPMYATYALFAECNGLPLLAPKRRRQTVK